MLSLFAVCLWLFSLWQFWVLVLLFSLSNVSCFTLSLTSRKRIAERNVGGLGSLIIGCLIYQLPVWLVPGHLIFLFQKTKTNAAQPWIAPRWDAMRASSLEPIIARVEKMYIFKAYITPMVCPKQNSGIIV